MSLAVACFPDEFAAAERLAVALGASLAPVVPHCFPDGESLPRVVAPASEVTVVYRSLDRPNQKLIDLLLAADAWRRAGVRRMLLVAPYFCYLRQDAVFAPGEPLSRDVVAPLIGRTFDGVVTVQAHLHRTRDFSRALGIPGCNLWAVEPLVAALPRYDSPPVIVGPDAESAPWAKAWAHRLGGELICLTKVRRGDRDVSIEAPTVRLGGRSAVIIDDIAASGRTLESAIGALRAAGAGAIDIAVAHALMGEAETERLRQAGARNIVSTDSVRHSTNAGALAPMLAAAVREMIEP